VPSGPIRGLNDYILIYRLDLMAQMREQVLDSLSPKGLGNT